MKGCAMYEVTKRSDSTVVGWNETVGFLINIGKGLYEKS